jgi:hypothetical protein
MEGVDFRPSVTRRGSHSAVLEGLSEFRHLDTSAGRRGSISVGVAEESILGSNYFEAVGNRTSTMSLSILEDDDDNDEYEIDSPASKSMGHASAFSTLMKHGGVLYMLTSLRTIRTT